MSPCQLTRTVLSGLLCLVLSVEPVLLEAATTRKPAQPPITVNRSVPKVDPPPAKLAFSSFPSDEEIAGAHVLPGPLLPLTPSSGYSRAVENRAMAQALLAYEHRVDPEDVSPLARFLEDHPGSRYEASLLTNRGILYRDQGRVTRAFPDLTRAWSLTKDGSGKNSLAVANWALAELTEMYAHLDRARRGQLDAVLDQLGSRDLHGPTTEKVSVAFQERAQLVQNPEEAFRCGPVSLALLREYLHLPRDPAIENVKASRQGFSLLALEDLANKSGMKMRAIYREPGAPVPFPSIIHWKYDHYSAILERKEERGKEYFRLENPLLDNGRWISREALDEESSGYYLVANDRFQTGWRTAANPEAGNVWGRCILGSFNLKQLMAWAVKAIHDLFAPSCGMPHYDFHAALASLNIVDTPLGYTPPIGPPVRFTVTYNQKESFQPAIFQYSNLGPKWTFDWFSSVNGAGGTTDIYLRGGGVETTQANDSVGRQLIFNYDPQSHAQLIATRTIPYEYERGLPDGSKEVFQQQTTRGVVLLTQVVDAQGKAIRFTYDSKLRMVAVTDAIGQVTTLSYGLPEDPLKITMVTDPFGRSASFSYDSTGRLTQITDVIGWSSTFRYGPNDFVQAMITPYGATSFETGHGPDASDAMNVYVQATDEFGTQRVEFRNSVPSFPLHDAWNNALSASTPPIPDMNTRLSSYWDKNAWKKAPGDYTQARTYQWLHTTGKGDASPGIVDYTKNALEGRVMYAYAGQTQPFYVFYSGPIAYSRTSAQPSAIIRLLEDGKTQQTTQMESNDRGHITKFIDPAGRQTLYYYDSNQIDLVQIINANTFETLARVSYNTQHLPTSSLDASGQTTTYTYNADGQILTVTDAKGQTSAFGYDSNGYLSSVTGPYPGATTTYTYDAYGRAATVTTSDGYTLAYEYDALDRLTNVTYPDGTFSQTSYDKLDPVASTDRQGRVTRTAYDSLRRPVSITDPLASISTRPR